MRTLPSHAWPSPAVARVSIELTTSALWARRSEPTELSRHGWPPRNRTARYLRIRQIPRRPAGSWPADGGGPDPQRSRALPGSSRSRLPAFQPGTTTWWFHLPRRRAGDSNATVLPAHPLATEPGTLAGSPSMSGGPGQAHRAVRTDLRGRASPPHYVPHPRFELGTSSF